VGVSAIVSILAAMSAALFGEFTQLHLILIYAMILDYLTGVLLAIINKKLSSSKAHFGVIKKVAILGMVAFAYQIDLYLQTTVICSGVIAFFIANESISLMENYKNLGLPVPQVLQKALEVFGNHEKMKKNDKSDV
jgi:toxin secretion/phage lysis holin